MLSLKRQPVFAAVLLSGVLATVSVRAEEDASAKVVLARYPAWKAGTIALKYRDELELTQLAQPATPKDVEEGRAIFSFQGLGPTPVWKLPQCPNFAHWPTLKDHPHPTSTGETRYDTYGDVCQAEELQINGRWKRYFGFLTKWGAYVVAADQICLSLPDEVRDPVRYQELSGGVDWGFRGPDIVLEDEWIERKLQPGQPALIHVALRNARGDRQAIATDWYRDRQAGGPALRRGVGLKLCWAPFDPLVPRDEEYPKDSDFVNLEPLHRTRFEPKPGEKMLECGQSFEAFALNLADWFKLDRLGFYEFRFELDQPAMGLPDEPQSGMIVYSFALGFPPLRKTTAELNQVIPPLGSMDTVVRLQKLVTSLRPEPGLVMSEAEENRAFPWSKAVTGLQARIEYAGSHGHGYRVLVRLKNVSAAPLWVPTGNFHETELARIFELHVEDAQGRWARRRWNRDEDLAGKPFVQGPMFANALPRLSYKLQPGRSYLVSLAGGDANNIEKPDAVSKSRSIKVVIREPVRDKEGPGIWSGVLETAPSLPITREFAKDQPKLSMPDSFPEIASMGDVPGNLNPSGSDVYFLRYANPDLFRIARQYDPAGVRQLFEQRMTEEKVLSRRLLNAMVAAIAGSSVAPQFLLASMVRNTEFHAVASVDDALQFLFWEMPEHPQWLMELAIGAISDERYATQIDVDEDGSPSGMSGRSSTRLSYIADEHANLPRALGAAQCRQAVPALMALAERTKGSRGPVDALGAIGDPRAIPLLMKYLNEGLAELRTKPYRFDETGPSLPEPLRVTIGALANLRAKDATPLFLGHLQYSDVIEALGRMGDSRAIPALRKLVAAEGKVEPERLFKARLALIALEGSDPIPPLCEMLADMKLGEYQRRTAVWRLGDRADARAVPSLVRAIQTDPSGAVRNQAIEVLSVMKTRAAVEGLIACFDVDYEGKSDWKRAYTPAMFRDNLGESLRAITGQSFGGDKQQWSAWWQETGSKLPQFAARSQPVAPAPAGSPEVAAAPNVAPSMSTSRHVPARRFLSGRPRRLHGAFRQRWRGCS